MSLTSILKNNPELTDRLKTYFPTPKSKPKAEMKAPPLTKHSGLIGTAFDYLLRFFLEHHNMKRKILKGDWVADNAYKMIMNIIEETPSKTIIAGYKKDVPLNKNDLSRNIAKRFEQAKSSYESYIHKGKINDKLIANTIFSFKP